MTGLVLRNIEIDGRTTLDVRMIQGRIVEIGQRLETDNCQTFDGAGGALLPGLIDHHLHLFGLAAALASVDASPANTPDSLALTKAVKAAESRLSAGAWLRIVGYDDSVAGPMNRSLLDCLSPQRPAKLQYRTGGLWVLNTAALAQIKSDDDTPTGVERDHHGQITGRVFREDRWMRETFPAHPPSLDEVARRLNAYGVTAVTDASVTTDDATAQALIRAARAANLRQRLTLMSGGALAAPEDGAFCVGPVKVLLDDDRLGDPAEMATTVRLARTRGRKVAVHCVTASELAYALAAFGEAGALPGDRIEHGGVIDDNASEAIASLGLTVVTQPAFVLDRGDRYLRQVAVEDQPNLYRIAGLQQRGVRVAASSDAPYASLDPWDAMRAAVDRRTRKGQYLGKAEGVSARAALSLYLGSSADPGGPERRIAVGHAADLCLMKRPIEDVLDSLSSDLVANTFIGGVPVA